MNTEILVPAERWEKLAGMNSCNMEAQKDKTKPVSVKSDTYQGKRYTAFGCMYGSLFESVIDAWEMLPEAMYQGETTTVYHDEAAIQEGRRSRGDMSGLLVVHQGKRYVLDKRVALKKGLPSPAAAISMDEAMRYVDEASKYGWRALFGHTQPSFVMREGHAFECYQEQETINVLLFRVGRSIVETRVSQAHFARLNDTALPNNKGAGAANIAYGSTYDLFAEEEAMA